MYRYQYIHKFIADVQIQWPKKIMGVPLKQNPVQHPSWRSQVFQKGSCPAKNSQKPRPISTYRFPSFSSFFWKKCQTKKNDLIFIFSGLPMLWRRRPRIAKDKNQKQVTKSHSASPTKMIKMVMMLEHCKNGRNLPPFGFFIRKNIWARSKNGCCFWLVPNSPMPVGITVVHVASPRSSFFAKKDRGCIPDLGFHKKNRPSYQG